MFEAIVEGRLKSNIHEYSIQDGCIFRGNRVFIPPSLRKEILSELHDGHLGVQKMKNLARSYVYWENIDADIAQLTKQCPACIRFAKAPNKIVHHWLPPEDSWQRIHVDHAGPFHGKYFLLIVDAYSKWIEVFIVPNLTTTSNLPYFREAFGRFGHPYVLVSDNHGCFASQEFAAFLAEMGSSMSSHPLSILHRTDRWRGTSKLSKQDLGRHFLGSFLGGPPGSSPHTNRSQTVQDVCDGPYPTERKRSPRRAKIGTGRTPR
ncbi:unnamed protein product [Nesidiocoris tenuis]|uniref:RNA-directed DNA polymerase n=1 Tax=Nesidiocoris tenuis TaxID=355587 RepID=A0A6H5GVJ4_9HEMI|nr:unnamed protein product [Nesidiocoris tenuis]